jgi:lactose/L-arabinose transport system ATP-binding protein
VQMRVEISRLHQELGTTMIFVTHDQTEAMTLADKIVVLRDGAIEQLGRPLDVYQDPDNRFVAGFIGSPRMNFLAARVVTADAAAVTLELVNQGGARLVKPLAGPAPESGTMLVLGVRPEHFGEPGQGDCDLRVRVDVAEHLGSTSYAYASTTGGEQLIIERGTAHHDSNGDVIPVSIAADRTYLFAADGRRLR